MTHRTSDIAGGDAYPGEEPQAKNDARPKVQPLVPRPDYSQTEPTSEPTQYNWVFVGKDQVLIHATADHQLMLEMASHSHFSRPHAKGILHLFDRWDAEFELLSSNVKLDLVEKALKKAAKSYGWNYKGLIDEQGMPHLEKTGAFDESEHPRDEDGKFTAKGDVHEVKHPHGFSIKRCKHCGVLYKKFDGEGRIKCPSCHEDPERSLRSAKVAMAADPARAKTAAPKGIKDVFHAAKMQGWHHNGQNGSGHNQFVWEAEDGTKHLINSASAVHSKRDRERSGQEAYNDMSRCMRGQCSHLSAADLVGVDGLKVEDEPGAPVIRGGQTVTFAGRRWTVTEVASGLAEIVAQDDGETELVPTINLMTAMALNPATMEKWIARYGPYLWHETKPEFLDDILREGLVPGKNMHAGWGGSRPDRVYLWSQRPRSGSHQVALRVDMRQLDAAKFGADDDSYYMLPGVSDEQSALLADGPISGWGDFVDDHPDGDGEDHTSDSLHGHGAVSYAGVIPPSALTEQWTGAMGGKTAMSLNPEAFANYPQTATKAEVDEIVTPPWRDNPDLVPAPASAVFTLQVVPLSKIRTLGMGISGEQWNEYEGPDWDDYRPLDEAITNRGDVPPVVLKFDGERYYILDGNHRLSIAKHRGLTEFPAYVYDPSAKQGGRSVMAGRKRRNVIYKALSTVSKRDYAKAVKKHGPVPSHQVKKPKQSAVDPEWWAQYIQQNPYSYHTHKGDAADEIEQNGLLPYGQLDPYVRGNGYGGIGNHPRWNHAYAAVSDDTYGNAESAVGPYTTFRIDNSKLDPSLIDLDEDFANPNHSYVGIPQLKDQVDTRHEHECPCGKPAAGAYTGNSKRTCNGGVGGWVDSNPHMDEHENVIKGMMHSRGAFAVRGGIPADALERHDEGGERDCDGEYHNEPTENSEGDFVISKTSDLIGYVREMRDGGYDFAQQKEAHDHDESECVAYYEEGRRIDLQHGVDEEILRDIEQGMEPEDLLDVLKGLVMLGEGTITVSDDGVINGKPVMYGVMNGLEEMTGVSLDQEELFSVAPFIDPHTARPINHESQRKLVTSALGFLRRAAAGAPGNILLPHPYDSDTYGLTVGSAIDTFFAPFLYGSSTIQSGQEVEHKKTGAHGVASGGEYVEGLGWRHEIKWHGPVHPEQHAALARLHNHHYPTDPKGFDNMTMTSMWQLNSRKHGDHDLRPTPTYHVLDAVWVRNSKGHLKPGTIVGNRRYDAKTDGMVYDVDLHLEGGLGKLALQQFATREIVGRRDLGDLTPPHISSKTAASWDVPQDLADTWWHVSTTPTLQPSQEHEHDMDVARAGVGALYVSHDPHAWASILTRKGGYLIRLSAPKGVARDVGGNQWAIGPGDLDKVEIMGVWPASAMVGYETDLSTVSDEEYDTDGFAPDGWSWIPRDQRRFLQERGDARLAGETYDGRDEYDPEYIWDEFWGILGEVNPPEYDPEFNGRELQSELDEALDEDRIDSDDFEMAQEYVQRWDQVQSGGAPSAQPDDALLTVEHWQPHKWPDGFQKDMVQDQLARGYAHKTGDINNMSRILLTHPEHGVVGQADIEHVSEADKQAHGAEYGEWGEGEHGGIKGPYMNPTGHPDGHTFLHWMHVPERFRGMGYGKELSSQIAALGRPVWADFINPSLEQGYEQQRTSADFGGLLDGHGVPYSFGKQKTSMAETRSKRLQNAGELDRLGYHDTSDIVHEFEDGWTVRRLPTFRDLHREGQLMRHCWSSPALDDLHGRDDLPAPTFAWDMFYIGDDLEADPTKGKDFYGHDFERHHMSLRDPDNLPHLSWFEDKSGHLDSAYGRNNSKPKDEYLDRIDEYAWEKDKNTQHLGSALGEDSNGAKDWKSKEWAGTDQFDQMPPPGWSIDGPDESEPNGGAYECSECGEHFPDYGAWREHTVGEHTKAGPLPSEVDPYVNMDATFPNNFVDYQRKQDQLGVVSGWRDA